MKLRLGVIVATVCTAFCAILFCAAAVCAAQALVQVDVEPSTLGAAPTTSWPTFNGDYSGERFSTLTQIKPGNMNRLGQQWVFKITDVGAQRGAPVPVIKCTPLMVDGILYITIPNHLWAIECANGQADMAIRLGGSRRTPGWAARRGDMEVDVVFSYSRQLAYCVECSQREGIVEKELCRCTEAILLDFGAADCEEPCDCGRGRGCDGHARIPRCFDPETGELQWTWWSTPRKGDAALKTWPNETASEHGGGMTWMPGTYDAELNLLYWPTGNTNPVFAGQGRPGANLWTESIVALDAGSGKVKWYFQVSPHDTHDFDNTTAPILFDRVVDGKPRKLLAQAARNGFFVTLDRETGEHLMVKPYVPLDYFSGLSAQGEPIPIADKDPTVGGSINIVSATNWPAPAYSPKTGLVYVNSVEGKAIYYLTDDSEKPSGYGGTGDGIGLAQRVLKAIDPLTGNAVWKHAYPNLNNAPTTVGPSILTTASGLLITGDDQKNAIIYSADKGEILWHQELSGNESGGEITYLLDGRQYIVFGAGDSLYAWSLVR